MSLITVGLFAYVVVTIYSVVKGAGGSLDLTDAYDFLEKDLKSLDND